MAGACVTPQPGAGVVGELVANRADLALFPLPLQQGLDRAIDITGSFLDGGTAIMVQKGTAQPSIFGFFAPFSWQARCRASKQLEKPRGATSTHNRTAS